MKLRTAGLSIIVSIILAVSSKAQQATARESGNTMATEHQDDGVAMSHDHHMGTSAPVTYAELENTAALLQSARQATEKYRDVRVAEADGYHGIGPDVPGMGIHYVGPYDGSNFDVAHPAILLYEKSTENKNGFALVGVSYLFKAPEGSDGQPLNAPFPKSLANWHRHENLCVLSDNSVKSKLSAEQCGAEGGHFTAETQWMVHAWIWKDSPAGVFSSTNPAVR
jgi:hypothetical protein